VALAGRRGIGRSRSTHRRSLRSRRRAPHPAPLHIKGVDMSAARPPEGAQRRSPEGEGSMAGAARPPEGTQRRSPEGEGSVLGAARPPVQSRDWSSGGQGLRYDAATLSQPDIALLQPQTYRERATVVSSGGRNAAWYVEGDFGAAVLRQYRRGGMMARVSKAHYFWTGAQRTRGFAEFELLQYLYESGLAVPRPLAAAYWRTSWTYRAALLTERLPSVRPLWECYSDIDHESVARAIFEMHEAGVWHADLNATNILVDHNGKVWLIDFDKSHREDLSEERRQANMLRLHRSLAKLAGPAGFQWWVDLNRCYIGLWRRKGGL